MTSSCTSTWSSNFQECGENPMFHLQSQRSPETHLPPVRSAWETSMRNSSVPFVWRNAPRIWRDFGSALPFQTRLTQTKTVLLLSNEHGSQVKDQGRRQCCHNKHKKSPYRPTRDVSLLSGHASYNLASSATSSCIIMNVTVRRRACNQVPKHAARCEFSDMMGRVTALYQECVLFDEWQQLCLVGHPRMKHDE